MTSGPIISWQIKGKKVEAVTDFLFLGSKITADGDCSLEIIWLLLGRKPMTNLDNVLKSKDISLLTKVKAMAFPIATYGCESWTIKKTVLKNWCLQAEVLEKISESPLDSKEIKPVNLGVNQP